MNKWNAVVTVWTYSSQDSASTSTVLEVAVAICLKSLFNTTQRFNNYTSLWLPGGSEARCNRLFAVSLSVGFGWCPPWRYPERRQGALWVSRQLILGPHPWIPRGLLGEVWSCGLVVRHSCLATKQRVNNSATTPGRFVLSAVLAQAVQTLYRTLMEFWIL